MLEEISKHGSLVGGTFANLIWLFISMAFLIKSGKEVNTKIWLFITVTGLIIINWFWACFSGVQM